MVLDTKTIISVSEANQNFSRAVKLAEKEGQAVIFKNNKPRYLLVDLEQSPQLEMTEEEKIEFVGRKILKKYHRAFEELAK